MTAIPTIAALRATALRATALLDWLLSLSRQSVADADVELGWRYPLPAWAWALIVIGAALIAAVSYRRMLGRRSARVLLATTRALLIVLLAVLLAGPELVSWLWARESDRLLVLIDRSQSMSIKDMPGPPGPPGPAAPTAESISRDDALRQALTANAGLFQTEQFTKDRRVVWLGFDAGVFPVDAPVPGAGADGADSLPPPVGTSTALRTAIDLALRTAADRRICGIVLMTDGRSPQDTGDDLVQKLNRRAAPVFVVPFGAEKSTLDLAIAQIDHPDKAFVNDIIPVTVQLHMEPAGTPVDPDSVMVRLIDPQTGSVLDEQHPADTTLTQPVRLSTTSKVVGPMTWRVELVYEPGTAGPPELITENNQRPVVLELVDRPIRVLYVEGYPRWEFRYLKNLLGREKSIAASIMLISADRNFAQEGDIPLTRLPDSDPEFEPYDVMIIGDVPAAYFSPRQLALMRRHVGTSGAGLLWIGGAQATPRTYDATDLAPTLPMRRPGAVGPYQLPEVGLSLRPATPAVARHLLPLRTLGGQADLSWPKQLPAVFWAQDIGELKPATEVLVEAGDDTEPTPIVTRMRYGAGQVVYIATDELWRWRYGSGGLYYDQIWTQLVRMLGRGRIQQNDQRARLTLSQRRANLEQALVVSLEIDDPLLLETQRKSIRVDVRNAADAEGAALERIELFLAPTDATSPADGKLHYKTVWRPANAGQLLLRVVEPALVDLDITQRIEVVRPDDELRHPRPDHQRLALLAQQTGGAVLAPDQLDELATLLPDDRAKTAQPRSESLWDSYLALFLVILLLTAEWIGRKVIRLA